jgi:hypothetical protein
MDRHESERYAVMAGGGGLAANVATAAILGFSK